MNDTSFSQIVSETKEIVLSAIEKNLADRFYFHIDDVVQETYIRAYKALKKGGFEERSKLSTWLYTIARNESRRMNERLQREEQKFKKAIVDGGETVHYDDLLGEEMVDELYSSIDMLPEKFSQVMKLVAQGDNQREISQKLNIRLGTVKSRISRGREKLEQIMLGVNYNE